MRDQFGDEALRIAVALDDPEDPVPGGHQRGDPDIERGVGFRRHADEANRAMAAKRRKPRLDDGDDAAGIEGEVEAGGDDRAERRGKNARLGGVDDMRRTKLLSDIAPRPERIDKNGRANV